MIVGMFFIGCGAGTLNSTLVGALQVVHDDDRAALVSARYLSKSAMNALYYAAMNALLQNIIKINLDNRVDDAHRDVVTRVRENLEEVWKLEDLKVRDEVLSSFQMSFRILFICGACTGVLMVVGAAWMRNEPLR
jgi:hypothetical protein